MDDGDNVIRVTFGPRANIERSTGNRAYCSHRRYTIERVKRRPAFETCSEKTPTSQSKWNVSGSARRVDWNLREIAQLVGRVQKALNPE